MSKLLRHTWLLTKKEFKLDFRNKASLYTVILYAILVVYVLFLGLDNPDAETWNALFWIITLFTAVQTVSKTFLTESNARWYYYYTLTSAKAVVLSKILYNTLLVVGITLITLLFYSAVLGFMPQFLGLFLGTTLLASTGFAAILAMSGAVASRASNNLSLMAIVSLPLAIPLLVLVQNMAKLAFLRDLDLGQFFYLASLLFALNVIVIMLSTLLFPYIWRD